jgi:hypothetical protein
VEAFPVVLYGSDYWSGLVGWMGRALAGRFIDAEDLEIFKVVNTPEDAVNAIRAGVKKHWWRPQDAELKKIENGNGKHRLPLEQISGNADAGEGTRYGRRPRRSAKTHVGRPKKPQQ